MHGLLGSRDLVFKLVLSWEAQLSLLIPHFPRFSIRRFTKPLNFVTHAV